MSKQITMLVCDRCGEYVSGPDAAEVAAVMQRHRNKKHPESTKPGRPTKGLTR